MFIASHHLNLLDDKSHIISGAIGIGKTMLAEHMRKTHPEWIVFDQTPSPAMWNEITHSGKIFKIFVSTLDAETIPAELRRLVTTMSWSRDDLEAMAEQHLGETLPKHITDYLYKQLQDSNAQVFPRPFIAACKTVQCLSQLYDDERKVFLGAVRVAGEVRKMQLLKHFAWLDEYFDEFKTEPLPWPEYFINGELDLLHKLGIVQTIPDTQRVDVPELFRLAFGLAKKFTN